MTSRWSKLLLVVAFGMLTLALPRASTASFASGKKSRAVKAASKASSLQKAQGKPKAKVKGKGKSKAEATPKATGKGSVTTKGATKGKASTGKGKAGKSGKSVSDRELRAGGLDFVHRVRKGDSPWSIARKYKVTVAELRRVNGEKKLRMLHPGQIVIIKVRDAKTARALRPYLKDWGRFEPGTGYVIKRLDKNYGRPWAIELVRQAIADLHERFPNSTDVFVGDFSGSLGGRIQHHLSHQTGRDVDLAYFLRGNPSVDDFVEVTPETVDVEKSWQLLESCLRTGRVQFVFMDYGLQPLFRAHAESLGYPPEDLDELFQYPRAATVREGRIRHVKGHADHLHVRFSCPSGDNLCK